MSPRVAVVASALLLLAACGREERPPDFYVRSVGVRLDTDAPFARQPGFPARLEQVLQAALDSWGGGWDALAGRTITMAASRYVACGGSTQASGCYDGELRVSTWDPGIGTVVCVEQTVLIHEVGHAVLGDPLHHDPRWMEMDLLGVALSGNVGYSAAGEVPCTIWVGVWRHPLDSP